MSIQYLLTNVNFDNTYKNMPYFNNELLRNNAIIGNKEFTSTNHNFNFGDVLYTSFVVNSYNNENYIIIQKGIGEYIFYFITKCEYKSVNQWVLTLELDVINQYLLGVDNSILSNCYVERGHCNLFMIYDALEKQIKFDVKLDSPMITSEKNMDMITISRQQVKQKYSSNDAVNIWLNDNILCWVYYYLDSKHTHKFMGATYDSVLSIDQFDKDLNTSSYSIGETDIQNEYTIISCPIYKTSRKMYVLDVEHKQSACLDAIENYRILNNDNAFIYNVKFSNKPPIDFNLISPYSSFDQGFNMIINHNATYGFSCYEEWNIGSVNIVGNSPITLSNIDGTATAHRPSSCFVNVNSVPQSFDDINIGVPPYFNVNNIVRGQRNFTYEPKIFVDCLHLVLRDSSNGEWVYNPLYFDKPSATPLYDEPLNITNSNYYFRLKPSGIIPTENKSNWTGIVNTVDYSQQIANNNYENFIANNKNFLLTKQVQQLPNIAMLSMGDLSSAGNIVNSIYNTMVDINTIKNKPNTMACVNDTVELNLTVNHGIKLYVDTDGVPDVELNKYYDYIYSHGYSINRFCNPCDYINTRKYFNYIKCELEGVNISAPDNVINKIRSIFRNGIRLWNEYEDMYNYNMENYEKWLERLI